MRSKRKLVLILAAGFVCLLLVAAALLQTQMVVRYGLGRLQDYLQRDLALELRVGHVRFDLRRFALTAHDVAIRSSQAKNLPSLFTADRLHVRLAPFQLFRNTLRIRQADATRAQINIFIDRQGDSNLPVVRRAERAGWRFLIQRLDVSDGSFRFEDQRQQVAVTLPLWRLQVTGTGLTREHRTRLTSLRAGTAGYEGRSLAIDRLELDAAFAGDALRIATLRLESGQSRVEASGTIEDLSAPRFDLRIAPDVDLAQIIAFAGLKEDIAGRLAATVTVRGNREAFEIAGRASGAAPSLRGYQNVRFEAAPRFLSARRELEVSDFSFRSAQGEASGNARLFFGEGARASSLDAQLRRLELQTLARIVDSPLLPATRASGRVAATWPGMNYRQASGRSQLQLEASRPRPEKNVIPIAGAVTAAFDPRRVQLTLTPLRTLDAETTGAVTVLLSGLKLQGQVQSEVRDVGEAMSQAAALLGRRPIDLELRGAASLQADLGGTLDRPGATASLQGSHLQIGGLEDVQVRAVGALDEARLVVKELHAEAQNQVLHGTAVVGLTGDNPVELHAQLQQASFDSILSIFEISAPSTGTIRASADIQGPLRDLTGTIMLSGSNLSVYRQPLGTLTAEARIAGNRIETTQFLLQKDPSGTASDSITGSGSFDLESRQFSFSAQGRDILIDQLTLPGNVPVRGTVNLNASGAGELSNASVSVNIQARELRVRDRAIGSASLTAQLRGEDAAIEASVPDLNLRSTARIRTREPYPATLEARLEGSDIAAWQALFPGQGAQLSGTVDATANAAGELSHWRGGSASLQIRNLRLVAEQREIQNRGPVELEYRDGSIHIRSASFASGNSTLEAAGVLAALEGKTPKGELNVKAGLELKELQPFLGIAAEGLAATGRLNADLVLAGSAKNLRVDGTISMLDGTVSYPRVGAPFSNISLDLRVVNSLIEVETAQARWAGADILLTGSVPLALIPYVPVQFENRGTGPARFALELRNLNLEATRWLPEGVAGAVDLRLSGEAPRPDVRALTAEAVFGRLQLRVQDYTLQQTAPTTISVRDGVARIERLLLTGPSSRFEAQGTAALVANRPLDLHMAGALDATILSLFSDQLRAAGPLQTKFDIVGTLAAPVFTGTLAWENGQFTMRAPRVAASEIDLVLGVRKNAISIEHLTGAINGGIFTALGGFAFGNGGFTDFNVNILMKEGFFDFPEGLKSVADADVTVISHPPFIDIAGDVKLLEASYRKPIETNYLLTALRSEETIQLAPKRSPFLERIRYDVQIESLSPILVDNNIAKVAANANLNLVGTYYSPSVIGRIDAEEGGEIYLNERRYFLDSGVVDLLNAYRIEPHVDVRARTEASGYDIALHISGPPENLNTVLTSDDPTLDQSDIMSLLLIGRKQEDVHGKELDIAKQQVLSLLAGSASEQISRQLQSGLGLTTVRIEPSLISSESNPGARLTLGEDLVGKRLRLVYSTNLTNSSDQIWIVESNLTRRFVLRGIKQDNRTTEERGRKVDSYRFEFQHDLRLGGGENAGPVRRDNAVKREIGKISFTGEPVFTSGLLQEQMKIDPGDRYDFFNVQDDVDRLQRFYLERGYLENRVTVDRNQTNATIDLAFDVEAGPKVSFSFSGASVPDDVRQAVQDRWTEGVFDSERADNGVQELRKWLSSEGHLQSRVEYVLDTAGDEKKVVFNIVPGPQFKNVELVFSGASGVPPDELKNRLQKEDLINAIYNNPQRVVDVLTQLYIQRGYLQAEVSRPKLRLEPATGSGQVEIPIHEGPHFLTGDLSFTGNKAFTEQQLRQAAALPPNATYTPDLINSVLDRLQNFYRTNGFTDAAITYQLVQNSPASQTDINFRIDENRRSVISELEVEGHDQTTPAFVLRQLTFRVGDVLDPFRLATSRKNLYDTGAYTLVDVQTEPVQEQTPQDPTVQPVRITVKVREVTPYRLRYGAFYDTEGGPGFSMDVSRRNFLNNAATLGLSGRYDGNLNEVRPYFSQPYVRGIPLKTDVSAFWQREIRPQANFRVNRTGVSLFQQGRFGDKFVLDYGYRYERLNTELFRDLNVPPRVIPIGRLTGTLTRDTRNDFLDAIRGSFTSQALEFAPRLLGSHPEGAFWRYYGQYFRYMPLISAADADNSRPRLVWAGGVRLGLAKGLEGQPVIPAERFYAGGGTTVRGFLQDCLGAIDRCDDPEFVPEGGEAVFILNNELRGPLFSVFDGVGFLDLGNVYPKLGDLSPTRVRKTAGIGLRVHTGYVVVRLDYGFKLDRRPGETRGAFFFSIGQAF
jgi:outer membrane protein assembly complex protein YaeT